MFVKSTNEKNVFRFYTEQKEQSIYTYGELSDIQNGYCFMYREIL